MPCPACEKHSTDFTMSENRQRLKTIWEQLYLTLKLVHWFKENDLHGNQMAGSWPSEEMLP